MQEIHNPSIELNEETKNQNWWKKNIREGRANQNTNKNDQAK